MPRTVKNDGRALHGPTTNGHGKHAAGKDTDGLLVTQEILRLVDASKEGRLTERAHPDQFTGIYREMVQGVNEMLDAILLPIGEGMRSRDPQVDRVRVVPELRRLIDFRRLNLMDREYGVTGKADLIFCRNVLIYFDRPTQQAVLQRLTHCLQPLGYLFLGHSETLHDMGLPLTPVAPALYRRIHAAA